MAFSTSNTARNNQASDNNESWKAQGFLNLYLPGKDGSKRKLGAIPLKESKPAERPCSLGSTKILRVLQPCCPSWKSFTNPLRLLIPLALLWIDP